MRRFCSLPSISNLRRYKTTSVNTENTIIVDKVGHITTIGINRPEKRNCVNSRTAARLNEAITKFEEDQNAVAGVLYGTGGNFCAGYDLNEIAEGTESVSYEKVGTMGPTLTYIKKPLVAAISGYAVAGGLELALMCDLRVIEETAVVGFYNRRFGVPLIDGGTVRLQATIGLSRALDLILTGRSLTAKEAFEWGLANRFVACGTALGQAINLAQSIVKFPMRSLLADRKSTYNAAFNGAYESLLKYEQVNGRQYVEQEGIEGARKFISGIGRHGKSHNLKEKDVEEWEKL